MTEEDAKDDTDGIPDYLKGDVIYARSHCSGGGSSLFTISKDNSIDRESDSSGRGSGSRIGSANHQERYEAVNKNLSALFSTAMPPVEKLTNPLATSYHHCSTEKENEVMNF